VKAAVKVQLLANMKILKFAGMISQLETCLRQAREKSEDYGEFLLNLTEIEVAVRTENGLKRRTRDAKFPLLKTH